MRRTPRRRVRLAARPRLGRADPGRRRATLTSSAALARVAPTCRPGRRSSRCSTAAALAEFAAPKVDAAVVEAGLGGRHDATNVLDARVVVLTNVSLEHTDVLGETARRSRAEKLAVVSPGATVCSASPSGRSGSRRPAPAGEVPRIEPRARGRRRGSVPRRGRSIRPRPSACSFPGRLERTIERPLEIWDGAHNLAGVGYLLPAPAGTPLHDRRLDPRRQGLGRDARSALPRRRRDVRRDPVLERARRFRQRRSPTRPRRRFPTVEAVPEPGLPSPAPASSRARTARSSSRARSTSSPISRSRPRTRTMFRVRGATYRLRLRRVPARPLRGARIRGGLASREVPAVIGSVFGGIHNFFQLGDVDGAPHLRGDLRRGALAARPSTGSARTRSGGSRSQARRARRRARRAPAVPRPADLHALPAARVPRGRARARARDQGDRATARRRELAAPSAGRRSSRTSLSAPSARRSSARPARGAARRSSRAGRCARTARRRSRPAVGPVAT